MARFVKFPGTAGSYASTADVNLLDADTAHLQQSIGNWVTTSNPGNIALGTPPVTSVFGTTALTNTTPESGLQTFWFGSGVGGSFPVVAGQTYTFLVNALLTETDQGRLDVRWLTGAGATVSTIVGTETPMPANQWVQFLVSLVAPATAEFANPLQRLYTDSPTGSGFCWVSASMVADGTVASFVPSLRIVGDLDVRMEMSAEWITTASNWPLASVRSISGGLAWQIIYVASSDTAILNYSTGGTPDFSSNGFALTVVDGQKTVIRQTRVAATGVIESFQDGSSLGTATKNVGPLEAVQSDFEIGSERAGTTLLTGDVFTGELRDGIDGPIVAQFNADDIAIP